MQSVFGGRIYFLSYKNNVLDRPKIQEFKHSKSDVAIMSGEISPDTRLNFCELNINYNFTSFG